MKGAIVFSHERSGTHFLMNTLADNFGYKSDPWIDLEEHKMPFTSCFHQNMELWFEGIIHGKVDPMIIIKSHHNGDFFNNVLSNIAKNYHIFYVYRNYEDVMKSYCKHINDLYERHEKEGSTGNLGPRCNDWIEFSKALPQGSCMKVQTEECGTMANRWRKHVDSWLYRPEVMPVKYEDLNDNFNSTVENLAERMETELLHGIPIRPTKSKTVKDGQFQGIFK